MRRDCLSYLGRDEHHDHLRVPEIVIAPEFQGRDIGSLFLKRSMDRARQWCGQPVSLGTFHGNRAVRYTDG